MTTLIIPSRCRVPLLKRCLESLGESEPMPGTVYGAADDDRPTYDYFRSIPFVTAYAHIGGRLGLWQTLNDVLQLVAQDEPFVFVGDDVTFAPDWLAKAEECCRAKFPDGLGLLSFNDGIQFHGNASHFMTTRRWLYVVFGAPFFPREYWHYFCDSELTVRSRDGFDRYHYCEASRVPHHWEPGAQNYSLDHDDYITKERRHVEWVTGGLEAARHRLAEVRGA